MADIEHSKKTGSSMGFLRTKRMENGLLSVNPGVPLADALTEASIVLSGAKALCRDITDAPTTEAVNGLYYLLEMAEAFVDAGISVVEASDG